MTTTHEQIIAELRARGQRITKARRQIVTILAQITSPISPSELIDELFARGVEVNKTTIYRELDFLQSYDFIREIDLLEGQKRYELHNPEHHHHHLVCTKCKAIQCIDLPQDLDALEARLTKQFHFQIHSHLLEFFGLCSKCQLVPGPTKQ